MRAPFSTWPRAFLDASVGGLNNERKINLLYLTRASPHTLYM